MRDGYRTYEVELDFNTTTIIKTKISFKQFDYGTSTIVAKLTNNGYPIKITEEDVVVAVFKTSQGLTIMDDSNKKVKSYATINSQEEGIINLSIPNEVIRNKGNITVEMIILNKSRDKRRTSPGFRFSIIESLIDIEEI